MLQSRRDKGKCQRQWKLHGFIKHGMILFFGGESSDIQIYSLDSQSACVIVWHGCISSFSSFVYLMRSMKANHDCYTFFNVFQLSSGQRKVAALTGRQLQILHLFHAVCSKLVQKNKTILLLRSEPAVVTLACVHVRQVWDGAESGRCLRVYTCHSGAVRDACWTPCGRQLLTGSFDNTVVITDVETGG